MRKKIPDDEKPFEGIFGNSTELKIIEHLIACPKMEFNITILAEIIGISRNVVTEGINRFLKWDIVKITNQIGNIKLYSINLESTIVQHSIGINNDIVDMLTQQEPLENQALVDQFQTIEISLAHVEPPTWLISCNETVTVSSATTNTIENNLFNNKPVNQDKDIKKIDPFEFNPLKKKKKVSITA